MKNKNHSVHIHTAKLLTLGNIGVACLMLLGAAARGQVINFDVPGGVGGFVNYSGQGALADLGNNYWNSVFTTTPFTTSGGILSDGVTASPITLTATYGNGGGAIYTGDGQGVNGMPAGLFSPFEDNKNSTFNTNTLNNVPPGTYNLYLYGDNGSDADRGTVFTVWTASTAASSLSTSNVQADANIFVKGVNYVEFTNLTLVSTGTISIKWTGNTAATNTINPQTEGIFNGLQLQTIALSPGISVRPTSVNVGLGNPTQLVSTIFGVPPFSYQWQKGTNGIYVSSTDTGDVSGSTTNILNFNAATISDAADYRLIVTNNYGSATSQVATVTVNLSPVISVQPSSATLVVGGSFQLTATAFGGLPLAYQWQKGTNGVFINSADAGEVSGSTTNVLNFNPVALSDAADYRLIVTNTYGAATSQVASVAVFLRYPVGARVPFTSYEAEAGLLGGGATMYYLTNPPTDQYSSPELEASGHAFVQINATGQYVQWTNNTGKNITAINLRSCIPDAPTGGGITNTIDLYVNGTFRQAFSVNSQQNYNYEGTNYNGQIDKNPADGHPRNFWNDTHAFITGAAVAPGGTIRFQMDSANTASFYDIDVADVENPPTALGQPTNSLSIISYGAVSNSITTDNTTAINNCFSAAQSQGKIAWIPPGTFYFSAIQGGLKATGIEIAGAGPWYSTLYRVTPTNNTQGVANMITTISCTLSNVALDCNGWSRDGANNNGAVNFSGNNWVVDNVWIQHATSAFWCAGVGGVARNCRVLSVWSDGGNFNNVQSSDGIGMNLTYANNFVRGTGDDAMAINSVHYNVNDSTTNFYTIMSNIMYINNTVVAPIGGKGIGIYGGVNDIVTNNLLCDTARYHGLGVMRFGVNGSDLLSATVTGNTLLRCGGNGYNEQQSAMFIGNGGDGHGVGTVENAYVGGNIIIDALYDGVDYSTSTNIVLQGNIIIAPALGGIEIQSTVSGNGEFDDNVISGLGVGEPMFYNNSSGNYTVSSASGTMVRAPIEAASYNSLSSASAYREPCSEGGEDLCNIYNGDYVAYKNVNLTGINSFVARVSSANVGGNIEIHLDSPAGTLVGTCAVLPTGGWQTWDTATCNVSGASGHHDVYLVFTGASGDLFNVAWFALLGNGNRMEAASCNSAPGLQTENCIEGGLDVTNISNGTYAVFNQVNLTGASSFNARVANAGSGGSIQIRLDSTNGTLIGTCTVSPTGGWQTWSTATCALNAGATGCHNVYLVFTGGGGNLFNLEWIQFQFNSATATPSNLALNQPVVASSTRTSDGVQAAWAVDGNLNTRWGSEYSDPQWIYVDLGANYNISGVTIVWQNSYAKAYQIQVSTNASTWNTIYSETNNAGGTENLTGLSGFGRYVRMYGTVRSNPTFGYSLWELEVFGNAAQPSVTPQVPPLGIQSASASQGLTLQWPDNGNRELASQPSIYYAPGLVPPVVWIPTTNTLIFSNGQWMATLPATHSQGFYRLQQ